MKIFSSSKKVVLWSQICQTFLFILLAHASSSGQSSIEKLKSVVPPSPNAGGLGKYGSWPVSLYTGVPEISIPVYQLKARSITVPVTLSYHASGIRVGETASWVGLGWSLQSGGVITRTVRGLPDDYSGIGFFAVRQQYPNPNDLANRATLPESVWKANEVKAAKGELDSELDVYSLNALGKSYTLLINGDGTISTIPQSNIKVTANFSTDSWRVVLEDGTVLRFGGTGKVERNEYPNFNPVVPSDQFTTAWYLGVITTTVGENIVFTYSPFQIRTDIGFSQSDFIKYNPNASSTLCLLLEDSQIQTSVNWQTIYSLLPSTIESDLVRIDFIPETTERLDLVGGRALSKIKIYSKKETKYIDEYSLNYVYSDATGSEFINYNDPYNTYRSKRLKLTSVIKGMPSMQSNERWAFDYNPISLPTRLSFSQDHWGYYNGIVNTTLLPKVEGSIYNSSGVVMGNGFFPPNHQFANRAPDYTYALAEMLTKITYPTGGNSTFNYEANGYITVEEKFASETLNLSLSRTVVTIPFTLSTKQTVYIHADGSINPIVNNDFSNPSMVAEVRNASNALVASAVISSASFNENIYKELDPGNYTFVYTSNILGTDYDNHRNNLSFGAYIVYDKSLGVQSFFKPVGGVRIASITDYDGIDVARNQNKYFSYANHQVIGPLDIKKEYLSTTYETIENCSQQGAPCYLTKLNRSSATVFSLGTIQGGVIGYGKVTTQESSSGANGKTVSYFSHAQDADKELAQMFPFIPADPRDFERGLLLTQIDYDNNSKPLQRIDNTYDFLPIKSIGCFKSGYETTYNCPKDTWGYTGVKTIFYLRTTKQVKTIKTRQVKYNNTTSDSVEMTTNYYFDNPLNVKPIRTETTNSRGLVRKTLSRTALEKVDINLVAPLSANASLAIDSMIRKNMVSETIQFEEYLNNILTNRATSNYKIWFTGTPNPTIIAPENVLVQVGSNAPETRIQFSSYDAKGNLLEQAKANDVKKVYIYDYSFSLPIAEASNADFASIAYTSFESDGSGNWAVGSTIRDALNAYTGNKSYFLSQGISKSGLDAAKSYIVSFWLKGGTALVNGGAPTAGKTRKGWTYYQHMVSGATTVNVSGTGNIDELRLYPQGAMMTTYTYDPVLGVTSSNSPSNKADFFEYDSKGRLVAVRDDNNNVLKTHQYNFKN
jgi:hypothetical protein